MKLPAFLIAGAQRAGTTYLCRLMAQHPSVFFPSWEPHFFTDCRGGRDRLLSEEQHQRHDGLSADLAAYSTFFGEAKAGQVIGDKSPSYMFMPHTARMIRVHLETVRIIFVLRDPVERAYSHYWHEVSKHRESLSFERALEEEDSRIARGYWPLRNYSYMHRGLYGEQIARFTEEFPADQILILESKDLYEVPLEAARRALKFVGLNSAPHMDVTVKTNRMRLPVLRRTDRALTGLRDAIGRQNPGGRVIGILQNRLPQRIQSYPPLNPNSARKLRMIFEPDGKRLAHLLGRVPYWLRTPVD